MSKPMIKSAESCRWDIVSMGEVMLRFDPGDRRVHTARSFEVWEGGGEYNAARALCRCFGKRAAVLTGLVDNPLGRLCEGLMLQGGVCLDYVKWFQDDGIGRKVRMGLNFTERGFGVRPALGCSDRANSAASKLKAGDFDLDRIFGKEGVRVLHTGGIFAALSESSPELIIETISAAKEQGTLISYDLNYRESLWKYNGGKSKAAEVNNEIVKHIDIILGNEEDFGAALGIEPDKGSFSEPQVDSYKRVIDKAAKTFPNIKAAAATLRNAVSATRNDWSALLYYDGGFYESRKYEGLEIYDRVGGGDSFASGLIYSLLEGLDGETAVNYGAAHGALAMTTPGDTGMASLDEVIRTAEGASARVRR